MKMDNCKHLFSENNILPQVLAELQFGSNRLILSKIKDKSNHKIV